MRSDNSATTLQVEVPDGAIGVRCLGEGPVVVMIPSLGRAADDFDDLAGRVAASARCGWHPDVAAAQVGAVRALDVGHWWEAGNTPVLVVHPQQDVISVAANADDIVERLGSRARLVTISDAGHALLPEQPDAVAAAVLAWLER